MHKRSFIEPPLLTEANIPVGESSHPRRPALATLEISQRALLQEVTRLCLPVPNLVSLLAAGEGVDPTSLDNGIDIVAFIDPSRGESSKAARGSVKRPFSQRYVRSLLRTLGDESGHHFSIHFQTLAQVAESVLSEPRRWRLWLARGVVLHGRLEDVFEADLLRFLTRPLDEELARQHRAHEQLAIARQQLNVIDIGLEADEQAIRWLLHSYDADGLDQVAYTIAWAILKMTGERLDERHKALARALYLAGVKAPQLQQLCAPSTPPDHAFRRQDIRRELEYLLAAAEGMLADKLTDKGRI